MGSRINLRLSQKTDNDIIDALENVKDVSKEVKKLIRLGLSVRGGGYKPPEAPKIATGKVLRPTLTTTKTTTKVNINDVSTLEANLLANFSFDDSDD